TAPPTSSVSPLSLHDALPILLARGERPLARMAGRLARAWPAGWVVPTMTRPSSGETRFPTALTTTRAPTVKSPTDAQAVPCPDRSEEHTSELQSPYDLVCRLL